MKQLIMIMLFCSLFNCTSQTKKPLKEDNTNKKSQSITKRDTLRTDIMESFDIKQFKKNNPYGNSKIILLNDSTEIRQLEYEEYYQEVVRKKNSPYSLYKGYSKDTGKYLGGGKEFYSVPVGIWKEFDENGKLVKETNWDIPYKFSIEDLQQKMQKEYNIDINNITGVGRGVGNNLTYYIVTMETQPYEFQEYLIDGITGKTLFISEPSSDEDREGIIEQYLNKEN